MAEDYSNAGHNGRLLRELESLRSMSMDVLQRLTILETSSNFADMQRQNLIDATSKLNDRLEPLRSLAEALGELSGSLDKLSTRVDSHEAILNQVRGALWTGRIIWAIFTFIAGGGGILVGKLLFHGP